MSSITFTTSFLTYEEWLKKNPDAELEEVECEDCEGTGRTECFHCGHEMECENCEGTGKSQSARSLYEEQLSHDKRILEKYKKFVGME